MYLILINPEAGNNIYKRIENKFKRLLDHENIKSKIILIEAVSDIPELINNNYKENYKSVVAMGANATVNATINALANADIPLGIIPTSRANYLAQHLGLKNCVQAVQALSSPTLHKYRVGKIGRHYFVGQVQ